MGGNKFYSLCLKFQESEAGLLLSNHMISIHFSTMAGVWGGGEEAQQGRIGSVKKVERRWRRWAFPFFFLVFSHFRFEGEEGVGRVGKPDCEQGVHREEILQEVKWTS